MPLTTGTIIATAGVGVLAAVGVYKSMSGSQGRGAGGEKKPCPPQEFVKLFLNKNYRAIENLDTSNLCLRVTFLPKKDYIDQQDVCTRQYLFAVSAAEFAKHIEGKGDLNVEDAFFHAGWSEKDIAEYKARGDKPLAVVWQAEAPLNSTCAATWDRIFNAVLPTGAKLAEELRLSKNKDVLSLWSANGDKNLAFANDMIANRAVVEKVTGWMMNEKLTVEDYFLAKNPADKAKVGRQVLRNLFCLDDLYRGDGKTPSGVTEYLVKTPFNAKLNRFFKYGELDPRIGFFSIKWADKIDKK